MFLVRVPETNSLVFFERDPRKDGFRGDVVEDVTLECPENPDLYKWPDGSAWPEVCVGLSRTEPDHFRVFRSPKERSQAGYEPVAGDYGDVYASWAEYQGRK